MPGLSTAPVVRRLASSRASGDAQDHHADTQDHQPGPVVRRRASLSIAPAATAGTDSGACCGEDGHDGPECQHDGRAGGLPHGSAGSVKGSGQGGPGRNGSRNGSNGATQAPRPSAEGQGTQGTPRPVPAEVPDCSRGVSYSTVEQAGDTWHDRGVSYSRAEQAEDTWQDRGVSYSRVGQAEDTWHDRGVSYSTVEQAGHVFDRAQYHTQHAERRRAAAPPHRGWLPGGMTGGRGVDPSHALQYQV